MALSELVLMANMMLDEVIVGRPAGSRRALHHDGRRATTLGKHNGGGLAPGFTIAVRPPRFGCNNAWTFLRLGSLGHRGIIL